MAKLDRNGVTTEEVPINTLKSSTEDQENQDKSAALSLLSIQGTALMSIAVGDFEGQVRFRNAFLDADWSLVEKTRRNTFLPAKALQSLHQNQFVRLLTLLPDWRIFSAMDSVPQLIKWLFARKTSDKLSL
ncbi:hypothetical protein HN51_045857 [Arachis hypogaea]